MLIVFFLDNYITYVESIGLLLCYVSYVTFMKYNATVETFDQDQITQESSGRHWSSS